MTISEIQFKRAFEQFDAAIDANAVKPPEGVVGSAAPGVAALPSFDDACGAWKAARPGWFAIIAAMRSVGTFVPFAGKAATAMEKVGVIVDSLCS